MQPVALPARTIPVSLRKPVQTELKRLQDLKVISPIEEPTDWVSQVVTIEKKNSDRVHICIDPRLLNKALLREHYHLPSLEEILPEPSKTKVFSKCDLRYDYWHVPLDAESWKLTCTQSPFGRFVWNRFPFSLKVSSEFFQKRVHAALADLPGIYCIADDICRHCRTVIQIMYIVSTHYPISNLICIIVLISMHTVVTSTYLGSFNTAFSCLKCFVSLHMMSAFGWA